MTKLTDDQLKYEYDLCYEILHGVWVDGELLIKGLLYESAYQGGAEQYQLALSVWKARFSRAEDEMIDRTLLS